jgi:hypothetical protein
MPASTLSAGDFYELSVGPVGSTRTYSIAKAGGGSRVLALLLRELLP